MRAWLVIVLLLAPSAWADDFTCQGCIATVSLPYPPLITQVAFDDTVEGVTCRWLCDVGYAQLEACRTVRCWPVRTEEAP